MEKEILFREDIPENSIIIKEVDGEMVVGVYSDAYFKDYPNIINRQFEGLFPISKNFEETLDFLTKIMVDK
jgi:hypothetical protein